MESILSKIAKFILKTIKFNKMWKLTGEELKKYILRRQLAESPEPPNILKKRFNIVKEPINEYFYYVMKPSGKVTEKQILYLHGGGYVYEINELHWAFLAKVSKALNCTITIPIYPLLPKHDGKEIFDMLIPIYKNLLLKTFDKNIVIMGDSAGGGMSLALAELLKEKQLPQPGNIILISPELDVSFTNPEIKQIENADPILALTALTQIGKWYFSEKGSKYYLASPIYGDFTGLGKISLFVGTNDILYPDAKRFKEIAEKKGIEIDYYEYESMIHVWPLLMFPESKKAREQIIDIIRNS
ncbi:alpha/beta hydrolase [Clostridium sp. C2-6-12]|uniref:alpha/beta hydrolase fold domain-containing protein n=1 Tax=Clostridium sp. C2-6-12 TaxID=2698832 RepID=UPI00136FB68C|nr:alpha/beta hydrolase [Clostridium sp. C2-6-12]